MACRGPHVRLWALPASRPIDGTSRHNWNPSTPLPEVLPLHLLLDCLPTFCSVALPMALPQPSLPLPVASIVDGDRVLSPSSLTHPSPPCLRASAMAVLFLLWGSHREGHCPMPSLTPPHLKHPSHDLNCLLICDTASSAIGPCHYCSSSAVSTVPCLSGALVSPVPGQGGLPNVG